MTQLCPDPPPSVKFQTFFFFRVRRSLSIQSIRKWVTYRHSWKSFQRNVLFIDLRYILSLMVMLISMGFSVHPNFRPPGSEFRSFWSGFRPQGSEIRPPETEIRPPIWSNFQSRKQLYNRKCLSVCPSVCKTPEQLEIIILNHSSFLIHPSFILPSFRDF